MKKNDFINGGIVAFTIVTAFELFYFIGKTKGYSEGVKHQKERMDIYNHGYADGCKQSNKSE